MAKKYPSLLKPVRIGDAVIKNRMVFPNASPHFLQGPEDYPSDGYRAYMANIARNGAGIVTIAEWDHMHDRFNDEMDMGHMQYFDTKNAAVQNYLSQMADEVHFYGSKLILSTDINFPEGFSLQGGPAFGPPGMPPKMTEAFPKERMQEIIDQFVAKMTKYRNLGYDGVTMRFDMIMQPKPVEREDEYGGSAVNRVKLVLDCYRAVKKNWVQALLQRLRSPVNSRWAIPERHRTVIPSRIPSLLQRPEKTALILSRSVKRI